MVKILMLIIILFTNNGVFGKSKDAMLYRFMEVADSLNEYIANDHVQLNTKNDCCETCKCFVMFFFKERIHVLKTYYLNKDVVSFKTLDNNFIQNGEYYTYIKSKTAKKWYPFEVGVIKAGKRYGVISFFNAMHSSTGVLRAVVHMKGDTVQGRITRFNDEGQISSKGYQSNVTPYGKWLFYDNNGVVSEKGKYKGEQIEWNHKQGIYIINGLDTMSFSDLNLKDYGFDAPEFKHYDLKVGLWKYYKDGKLYRKEKYDKTGKIIYRRDL